MKRYFPFLIPVLFWVTACSGLPVDDAEVIANRDYVPALYNAVKHAKKSIHIIMYSAGYYPDHPEGVNRRIYKALVSAKKKRVDVKVILEASDWNPGNTKKNKQVGDFLEENGVPVWWDPIDVTTHCKLIIIDRYITIVGSTNWTYYALARNNEASVLIKSKPVAEEFEKYFKNLMSVSADKLDVE